MTGIRHSILVILSIVAIGLAAVMVILAPHNRALAQPGHEAPGFHGMLVLGAERIYVSHLPMFTAEHRYQGIWQVTFAEQADQTSGASSRSASLATSRASEALSLACRAQASGSSS
jgi:hypothetical protein